MRKLLVISHKKVWQSNDLKYKWATDGGFVFHMAAIGAMFSEIEILVPRANSRPNGEIIFKDPKLTISPLNFSNRVKGVTRKIYALLWGIYWAPMIFRKIKQADLIHVQIPSDMQ